MEDKWFEPAPGISQDVFMMKYAAPGETSWKERAQVVAKTAAMAEKDDKRETVEKSFYHLIRSGDFIPGGRILFGSGRRNYNLLNCYVLGPEDSVESISKLISDAYKISCAGGGIGFNFSKIRPKGDDIQNIKNSAPGSVSVIKMINAIGNQVRAGKNRRTALMGILSVSHPDLFEFLSVKLDKKELNNFNISVAITDRFIEAVENDEDWYFVFNGRRYNLYEAKIKSTTSSEMDGMVSTHIAALSEEDAVGRLKNHLQLLPTDSIESVVECNPKARLIWDNLTRNAVESGDPGIINLEFTNKYTNVSYFEDLLATNPCGEEPLPPFGNCDLGHINLNNFIDIDGNIDWKRMARAIRTGVRFLDNILTINHFPIPECAEVGNRSRRIGLGVTGLHYFLIKAGLRYGSEKCMEFLERLFQTIRNETYKSSMYLAREKGSFPMYNFAALKKEGFFKTLPTRIRSDIKKNGLRNAVMLTVAPTGTVSIILGVSTGIEPIFSPIYKRRYKEGNSWVEEIVIDPLFKDFYLRNKDLSLFVGAYDVTPEEHIMVQAVIQSCVDSAVSKTCNLPNNAMDRVDEISKAMLEYAGEVKGFTVYRAGSKGNEPLESIPLDSIENLDEFMKEEIIVEAVSEDMCKSGACEV